MSAQEVSMKFDPKTPNVGNVDRAIRAIVGALLVIWALAGGPVWAWVGVVPLATAIFRFCPAYTLFGYSTCAPSGPTATPKM